MYDATVSRLVLVHGSVTNGAATWGGQRELGERFDLVVLDRPGFPGGLPAERVDSRPTPAGSRRCCSVATISAATPTAGSCASSPPPRFPELGSLTAIEPPATRVAQGDPAADAFAAGAVELWRDGPGEPEAFLRDFSERSARRGRLLPLPPALEQGARALMAERGLWEAEIPLPALRQLAFPKLVVSGAHHAAFDAICDVLERELRAERAVLPGAGHTVQRAPGFNDVLVDFLAWAEAV